MLFTITSKGQEYYFKHFKVENGLSHNTVLSSLQDKKGFMWFGTKNGLNRFDGYTFKLFQNNPDDPKSLWGNYVECLHEFNTDIWVGTDNGLFKYNEKFENFDVLENTINIPILDIESDSNGHLWYIAGGTLHKYNPSTKEDIIYPAEQFFYATDITKTIDNEIWVASTNHLFKYESETESFNEYELNIIEDIKFPFRINKLFSLATNTILLGTQNHGVIAFDIIEKKRRKFLPEISEPLYVRGFALKNDDELWIASESGIHIYNIKTEKYTNLKKNYNNPYALTDNAVYSLVVDNENGVWAGTYFGGVNYFPKQYTPFTKFFPKPSENSISGNAVREIHSDNDGNIWIGTEDAGLNKYNPKTGLFTNYTSIEKGSILSHYNIHAILPRDNKLWIGTFDHGIDIMDIHTNKIMKHFSIGETSDLRSNFVFSLYETKEKEIFAITTNGIQTYNEKNDKFTLVAAFPKDNFYTCFLEDNKGTLWAGSYSNGLFYYNPRTKEKGIYKYDGKRTSGVGHNHINGIFEDSKNNIWVTTENGLNLFDPAIKDFKKYSTKDGFPSNVFYSIIEDDDNKLWISTSNGLVVFEPETNSKKIYTKANGLLSDQFNYNSAYKDANGRMYFGSVSGMISFNPKDFIKNSFSPPIYITGLQIDNQEVFVDQNNSPLKESITLLDHIQLNDSESSFSINFATLSYAAPEITEYWYKLEGLNSDWVPLKTNNKVYFTKLAPGNYNFKVKSLNSNGVWSEEASDFKINLLPPYYASNGAYLTYTVLASLLIFFGFSYYHKQTEFKNNQKLKLINDTKEKEIYQAKIEFFTNVSHEIRTPLTLIKSPLEKIIKKTEHLPELKDNLSIMDKNTTRLLDLVNQLLDFRKTEIEGMSLTFVETNISDIIRNTYNRFSEAIEDKGLNFNTQFPEDDVFAYVDAEAIKKILSNLFGNAIKYAGKNIYIHLSQTQNGMLELLIKNDGNLIPPHLKDKIFEPFYRVSGIENQTGTGIGLSLAHSLAELHNGTLKLDTSDAKLNIFLLRLPIHQEKEFNLYNSKHTDKLSSDNKIIEEYKKEGLKPTILLVEDNLDLLDFVAKDLSEDYFVIKATNGELAMEIIKEENIQMIVSDVTMPNIDGFTLCKNVKTCLESSHIPIILLTAKNSMNAKMEGLESGADAYIEKPFSIEYLKVQIANLIENRKIIMEHYASSPLAHIRSIASTKTDEAFIRKLDETIDKNLNDPNLNVETLAEIMHMSRSTLYRKINDISNLSPNELINISRLKKAAELLKSGDYKIYEVAEIVGYNSSTSFGRNFQKQFEMTPTEYISNNPEDL